MAVYSDEKRPILAKWIKITLFINVLFFLLLVFFWVIIAGPEGGMTHTGYYATLLLGMNVFAFLFYERLFSPDDDVWRRLAEVLGTLQVLVGLLTLLVIIGTIGLVFFPGLIGTVPTVGAQPAVAGTTAVPAATAVAPKTTECYMTAQGCMPLPPTVTIPPVGNPVARDDPILGSFTFDKAQFDPKQNYYSRAGNYEYNYLSVPLDHSPDIKWTFREDGVLLFYDTTNGNFLRSGTWTKTELQNGKAEYRIKRGNYDYRGTFQDTAFRITSPDFWNMTKVG